MSYDFLIETVPPFNPRAGDVSVAGSNNSLLVLGRDRPSNASSGIDGKGTGTAHLVVGRSSSDVSLKDDRACLYVSMKTDADGNFGTSVEGSTSPSSAAVLRADQVRLSARTDLKFVIDGKKGYLQLAENSGVFSVQGAGELRLSPGSAVLDSKSISLGAGAPHALLQGTPYSSAEQAFLTALAAWAASVSGGVIPAAHAAVDPALASLQTAISGFVPANYLSKVVKTV